MIQGVISRMSGFSATAKNFAVTVSVALVALAFDKGAYLLWAGVGALLTFLALDFYYHLLEVRFRELYRSTAISPVDPPSDMLLNAPKANGAHVKKVLLSFTLLPFYVLLLFLFSFALYGAAHVSARNLKPDRSTARRDRGSAQQVATVNEHLGGPSLRHPTGAEEEHIGGPTKHPVHAGTH